MRLMNPFSELLRKMNTGGIHQAPTAVRREIQLFVYFENVL